MLVRVAGFLFSAPGFPMVGMKCAVILFGPIGGGKTTTAFGLAERARIEGLKVMGILSRRVIEEGNFSRYDLVDLETGNTIPLVKPANKAEGEDWETHGNPVFAFSKHGFEQANLALHRAAESLKEDVIVFVDEYGRLESKGAGIYISVVEIADALRFGGSAVFLCRNDKVEELKILLKGKAQRIFTMEAGDPELLWRVFQGY
jgi:nucleoside-triphosphatase THEP1